MNFITEHIQAIIQQFKGDIPLAVFLKNYYSGYKNIGSRDRKAISEGVYIYYRCARFYEAESIENIIAKGIELCKSSNKTLSQKITADKELPHPDMNQYLYPISNNLALEDWLQSIFHQPKLFIRLRENENSIIHSLKNKNIEFASEVMQNKHYILSFNNSEKVNELINEKRYVVQDRSSQIVILKVLQKIENSPKTIWDVCSGAGGKSLLIQDVLQNKAKILATDIRKTILHNLQQRAKLYGIQNIETIVCNATDKNELNQKIQQQLFDLVICDVPCSGSGTWARTPEQFYFFPTKEKLNTLQQLQKDITINAANYVQYGGYFLYITCSVFKTENEDVVAQISQNKSLKLIHSKIINGIPNKADIMFYALFKKIEK